MPKQPPKLKLEFEARAGFPHLAISGVDEVGRGCLAGPVVAAAVVLPAMEEEIALGLHPWLARVTDSKQIPAEVREELDPLIRGWVADWAVAEASVEEIDRLNIYHASQLAMVRAVEALKREPDHLLVDGHVVPRALRVPATAVVKGDARCLSIACASILAKVHRDRLMSELDSVYPGYSFGAHKGYPTPAHLAALDALRPSPIHRRSFAPVAKFFQGELLLGEPAGSR